MAEVWQRTNHNEQSSLTIIKKQSWWYLYQAQSYSAHFSTNHLWQHYNQEQTTMDSQDLILRWNNHEGIYPRHSLFLHTSEWCICGIITTKKKHNGQPKLTIMMKQSWRYLFQVYRLPHTSEQCIYDNIKTMNKPQWTAKDLQLG